MIAACDDCLRRTELVAWLSGHIEQEWRLRRGRPLLLALSDEELLAWAGEPDVRRRHAAFAPAFARDRLTAAGLGAICRCSDRYPAGLAELPDPPAVAHHAGDHGLLGEGAALVGARTPTPYGREVAAALARGLTAAGVTVVSGMALGIDSVAHSAALSQEGRPPGSGATVAVLATGADRAYPARSHELHRRIAATGCVVSEFPPGHPPRRWQFPARNRLIAALSAGTVVVEGGERSGSLITADFAAELGRFVAAVPGPVTSRMSEGPHTLLKSGAELVRHAGDVLDLLGLPTAAAAPLALPPHLARLLRRIEDGAGSLAELATPDDGLAVASDLSELERRGLITRVFGGRYIRAA